MSGESTRGASTPHEALETVFGERTRCSACAANTGGYRVLTLFLHDHAVVRAYCPPCYEDALDGDCGARGEVLILAFDAFAARFGCPGPRPRPSPLDRALLALMRDPALAGLSPATECLARRRGPAPHRFTAEFRTGGEAVLASFLAEPTGAVTEWDAHPSARERVERAFAEPGT